MAGENTVSKESWKDMEQRRTDRRRLLSLTAGVGVGLAAFALPRSLTAQSGTGSVQVLDDWARYWSSQDVDRLLTLFTDDVVYDDVGLGVVNRGKAELRAFAESVFVAFPDFKFELPSRFVAGEWGAIEWVLTATHLGDLPGLPARGKSVNVRGASVIEFQGGRIRRNADYWDFATLERQIGPNA